ncbi:LppA family lipoprotein [Amycolatopsis nigrescens]|uniref:LppA family lipoprotein n=1 Tax=Amycolatopsis nigrescens TaxID=381445 RepID=UPI0009FEF176|nr:LppA family lipoprotein [Amycolatopsis nigrescens]
MTKWKPVPRSDNNSLGFLATAIACTVVLTACSNGADPYLDNDNSREDMSLQHQWSELMQRPNIDEVVAKYEKMQKEVTEALSSELGLPQWSIGGNNSTNPGCNDFRQVDSWDAIKESIAGTTTPARISTEQWPKAVDTIKRVVAGHGFTTPGLVVDKGDFHTMDLYDGYGAKFNVMTGTEGNNTVIGVSTGCHLLPEAKQRGVPRSTATPPTG